MRALRATEKEEKGNSFHLDPRTSAVDGAPGARRDCPVFLPSHCWPPTCLEDVSARLPCGVSFPAGSTLGRPAGLPLPLLVSTPAAARRPAACATWCGALLGGPWPTCVFPRPGSQRVNQSGRLTVW